MDGTGEFLSRDRLGEDNWWLRIRIPGELDPYVVYWDPSPSMASAIAALEECVLSVAIIPHTYRNTTLATYRSSGARVNLECDILAEHVEKLLRKLELKSGLTVEQLREEGY